MRSQNYFEKFFEPGGKFLQFIEISDDDDVDYTVITKRKKKISMNIIVQREDLVKEMQNQKIIKMLENFSLKSLFIFDQSLKSTQIDFLSIDCEGLDYEILKSNDWNKYRPKIVCIETHGNLGQDYESEPTKFMNKIGYSLKGKTLQGEHVGTLFFME